MSRPLLLIVALFLFLALIPVSAGAARNPAGWYDATLAAWVQAIGSILAVAGAAAVGLMQAEDLRRRDQDALRQRALDVAEDRVQVLYTAIKVCQWAQLRLTTLADVVGSRPPLVATTFLPMVLPEFPAFQARLAGLSLHGQHMVIRENIIAAEGFVIAIHSGMAKAVDDMKQVGADAPAIRTKLLENMQSAASDLGEVATTLAAGVADLRARVAALEPDK